MSDVFERMAWDMGQPEVRLYVEHLIARKLSASRLRQHLAALVFLRPRTSACGSLGGRSREAPGSHALPGLPDAIPHHVCRWPAHQRGLPDGGQGSRR